MLERLQYGIQYICKGVRDPVPTTVAEALRDEPGKIIIYDLFFTHPVSGSVSRQGVLVHELSHMTPEPATDDTYDYVNDNYPGLPSNPTPQDYQNHAMIIATAKPELAVKTADAYEFFAENLPALPMTTESPCCDETDDDPLDPLQPIRRPRVEVLRSVF